MDDLAEASSLAIPISPARRPCSFVAAAIVCALGCGCDGTRPFASPVRLSGPSVSADGFIDRIPLSVWGDSPRSVFFVGGGIGVVTNGMRVPGLFVHWDGALFQELGTISPTLWWVTGFAANDVWAVGEKGSVAHWNGTTVTVLSGLADATLAGTWGTSSNDLWAVGGALGGEGTENDVILHCAGHCDEKASWARVAPAVATGLPYFKIWGATANDVYLVGVSGLIEHWNGSSWSVQATGTTAPLITVNGSSATNVYAVGGPPGLLLHSDGTSWTADGSQHFSTGLTGVFALADGDLIVVGLNGQKYRRAGTTWTDFTAEGPSDDWHSVWVDATGKNGFIVGGNYTAPASAISRRLGVIMRIGDALPPSLLK